MNYLNEKTPPVREDRLGAGIAFGGLCRELCSVQREGCLNKASRSFSQSQGCQFTLSLAMTNSLRNAVIIMHGPIGCGASCIGSAGGSGTFKRLRDPKAEGLVWINTNLDEADVINGGENKLRESILRADREFRPEIIVVTVSCVPSLIGDDVDAVIAELQEETAASIFPVHCPGFKTKVMATAYDDVYHGILRSLVRRPVRREDSRVVHDDLYETQRRYRESRTVNVLNVGMMSRQDELELERLIEALGLKARFLPCYSDDDDFREALESSLNVSICGTHDDYFLEHLKELYNIPYIIDTMPVGRKNTGRWLTLIASRFGLEAEAKRLIDAESDMLDKALEPLRAELKGKKAFLTGGAIRVLATAEIAQDLGMEIVGLKGHHYDGFANVLFENLENVDDVVINIATQQPFEHINLAKRLKPDIFISHTGGNNLTAKLGIPILPIFSQSYNYMGYSGVYEIARRMRRLLFNSRFNLNIARHRRLPYRESWYEKDPFAYIKREG
ncbi:MAG: nitrogenase component 1 [Clostridiales bacterium]|jgi:nitrogenase molybdenum-iron protein alpha chain|nr:nitrogenase component 1 [Clostridiales bacterium]